jgi:hypothetical protein
VLIKKTLTGNSQSEFKEGTKPERILSAKQERLFGYLFRWGKGEIKVDKGNLSYECWRSRLTNWVRTSPSV